jgi:hypothetical protein
MTTTTTPAELTKEITVNYSFPGIVLLLLWFLHSDSLPRTDMDVFVYLLATVRFVNCKLTPQSGTMTISNTIFGSG